MADGSKVDVASRRTPTTESKADSVGRNKSIGRNYGGGCATRCGMERSKETKRESAGCTQWANPIGSISAIVASNPGDFGQGRVGASNTCASRLPCCVTQSFLCLKRSKHKLNLLNAVLSRTVYWQNLRPPGRILPMDPSLISKVMQEMGRKGGKKGGKKGAKMRAEALTPERRSQIARKAAKSRWAKAKEKTRSNESQSS
jgi:hypothetical protein